MAINREDWIRSVVPAGTVIAFAGATPPTGWLLCNGSTISRSAYPALFTAISVAHGSGDGSTTFHLPDYQGRFLRGVANGSANDPDRAGRVVANAGGNSGDAVGSVQDHQTNAHTHFSVANQAQINNTTVNTSFAIADNGLQGGGNYAYNLGSGSTVANASPTNSSGGNETRPKNSNVNYIIKA